MTSNVRIGDPFWFGVLGGRMDGFMDDFAVDAHIGVDRALEPLIEEARGSCFDHGGEIYIFRCVRVAKVTRNKTHIYRDAPDEAWRVMGEAALSGNPL